MRDKKFDDLSYEDKMFIARYVVQKSNMKKKYIDKSKEYKDKYKSYLKEVEEYEEYMKSP